MNVVAHFSSNSLPELGLTPVIRIRDLDDGTLLVNADPLIEKGDGFYTYLFVDYDPNKKYGFTVDGGPSLHTSRRYIYLTNTNFASDILTVLNTPVGVTFN